MSSVELSSVASCIVKLSSEELQGRGCETASATVALASDAATADVASGVLVGAEPCQGCGPLSAASNAAELQSDKFETA